MQVTDEFNGQQASLDILASGITARVEDMEKGYSEISQTADRISSRVESLYGNYSQILQTADSITSRVEGIEGNYSEILQTADMIQSRVEDVEGNYSEIKQTANSIISRVENIDEEYGEMKLTVKGLNITTRNGTSYIDGAHITTGTITLNHLVPGDKNGIVFHSQLANENNTTTINGNNIKTGTIDAHKVRMAWQDGKNNGGGFTVATGSTSDEKDSNGRPTNVTYGAMMYGWQNNIDAILDNLNPESIPDNAIFPNNYIIATNGGVRMTHAHNGNNNDRFSFYIADNGAHIVGTTLSVGGNPVVVASDKNIKNNISYEIDKYDNFYQLLKPAYYKYNDGTSNRFHIGFIYQKNLFL